LGVLLLFLLLFLFLFLLLLLLLLLLGLYCQAGLLHVVVPPRKCCLLARTPVPRAKLQPAIKSW
jgi:hypothetical protein